ncbi:MAG: SDR family NAD(P)-dependent oxidoreductase, partial [Exilispira sp.]
MLKGKKALITGASSGIGFETAKLFAKNNVNLLLFSRNIEKLKDQFISWENEYNIKIEFHNLDVRNIKEIN